MVLIHYFWSLSSTIILTIIGILGIGFLIGFHELGHFLFGKLFKIRTPSFSIGFGPRLFSKKIGETEFVVSAIPLGGYVEFAGSAEMFQGEQKEAMSDDKHSFASKPYYQKMIVMAGGILFNMIFAYFTFIFLCLIGLPESPLLYPLNATTTIEKIESSSAAEKYGLQAGDSIIALNNISLNNNVFTFLDVIKPLAYQDAQITIERAGELQTIPVTIGAKVPSTGKAPTDENQKVVGSLGIEFKINRIAGLPLGQAIIKGITFTNTYIIRIFHGFISMFSQRDTSQLAGPLMIVSTTVKGAAGGYKVFLLLLAIISINLAILNLVPLPILDGGQMVFYTLEAIIRRPLPHKIKEAIHIGSWIFILLLVVYISAKDLFRMAGPLIQRIMALLK